MSGRRIIGVVFVALVARAYAVGADDGSVTVDDYRHLPTNTWTLIHHEAGSGGKAFARVIYAENVDRLYLVGHRR
jgi:hypothetical protein